MEVGLSLGSNLGDRLQQLKEAKRRILAGGGVTRVAQSPVYETAPVDVPDPYRDLAFLNGVLVIQSRVSVGQLLLQLQFVEQALGRQLSSERNAPRPIDIDIIYADQLQVREHNVTIPHPRWAERRFVVQPLSDVRPDLVIPGQSLTVAGVLAGLKDRGTVVRFEESW